MSIALNSLRSPDNAFTLVDILKGENKQGERLVGGDFIFEYEKPGQGGLNARPTTQTVNVPRERIFGDSQKTSLQLAEEIISEQGRAFQEIPKIKARLELKIMWYKYVNDSSKCPDTVAALKTLINCIKITCKATKRDIYC